MEFNTLDTNILNEVLFCRLNRPDKRNALNREMLNELLKLFESTAKVQGVRVLVLRGSGKVFSAGADLSQMSDVSGKDFEELQKEAGLFYDCFDALYRLPIPTVCYAHGGVHGGANGLLAACDYTLAEKGTVFSFGEVRLGLIPATVAPYIIDRTGLARARRMLLGGHSFTGRDALEWGLIDQLCLAEEADEKIRELTEKILQNAPGAMKETKRLLLQIGNPRDPGELRDFCTGMIASQRLSEEAREGIEAFFSKRKPGWVPGQ